MTRDDDALNSGGASPFVINLASRMKNIRPLRSRGAPGIATSSEIYIFPAPPRRAADNLGQEDSTRWYRHSFAVLPRWIRALTLRRVLMLGAAACYALILFNLIYGIASLARLKSWRPIPSANAMDLQRTIAAPVGSGLSGNSPVSTLAAGLAPAYCKTENLLEAPRPARHSRRVATRKSS